MNTVALAFGKDKTAIIKGIAILFMMILHCGGSGATYDVPIRTMDSYPILGFIHPSFKLCVGIFTFMVGYGYAFAKVKDWRYSLKHIWSLLKVFWLILIVITIPSILLVFGGKSLIENGLEDFIQNLFGVSESLNWYSWFVSFYIFCMVVLPLISRWLDKNPILFTIGFSIGFYLLEVCVHSLPTWESNKWLYSLFNDCMLMPTVLLGYYFAKQQVFRKISIPHHWLMALIGFVLIIIAFIGRAVCGTIAGFNMYVIHATVTILGILIIFNSCNLPILSRLLTSLGNASVYMWFFHALFFTTNVRDVYQPFILVSNNIFIITLWTILLTYICSWVLKKIVDSTEGLVSKPY